MKLPKIMNPLKELGEMIYEALSPAPRQPLPKHKSQWASETRRTISKSSIDLDALLKASEGDPDKKVNVKAKWLLVVLAELETLDVMRGKTRDHSFIRVLAQNGGEGSVQVTKGFLKMVHADLVELQSLADIEFNDAFKDLEKTITDFDKTFKDFDFDFNQAFKK